MRFMSPQYFEQSFRRVFISNVRTAHQTRDIEIPNRINIKAQTIFVKVKNLPKINK